MRLHLAARFLGGVEGVIEDRYTCFGILPVTIGPVGSEYRTDFLDVFRLGRLAVEVPPSNPSQLRDHSGCVNSAPTPAELLVVSRSHRSVCIPERQRPQASLQCSWCVSNGAWELLRRVEPSATSRGNDQGRRVPAKH